MAFDDEDLRFDTTEDLIADCSAPVPCAARLAGTDFTEATVRYHDSVSDRKRLKQLICYPRGTTTSSGAGACTHGDFLDDRE